MLTHLKRPRSFPRYAISIRQPWAELILRREKSAEFRLWRLPERYWNQWLWLHTPAVMGRKEKEAAEHILRICCDALNAENRKYITGHKEGGKDA